MRSKQTYFEDGGMRFELDTGWGSGDAEIILDLARNSKGKSYGEFLSVNTSGINEVDMAVGNRNDPYEMQRFITSLKDYRQDIEEEAARLGDDSVLNSSEYNSLVAQITEAEEAFEQLNGVWYQRYDFEIHHHRHHRQRQAGSDDR